MASTINGIEDVVNPMLIVMPIILMSLSGYGIGRLISSKGHKINTPFFKDLIYGNVIINFIFISGFVFFGVITYHANEYFRTFTYILIILSLLGTYFIIKKFTTESGSFRSKLSFLNLIHTRGNVTASGSDVKYNNYGNKDTFVIFGIALFAILIGYHGIIIYYHPIFNEYDSVYFYLPISKSILLGNGLNHNYFSGSDISMRFPPYTQALNAWLIQSFGYSSLRAFPVYFVFFAALAIYYLAESVTRTQLLRIIASSIFLLAPAILATSSRFSLQEDLPFIFFLAAGFNFLFEIVWEKYKKLPRTLMIMLVICLSLMPLTRQVGLFLSVAIFFLVPAIKFTNNNLKLRALFTFLSFLPLYVYEIHEMPSIVGIALLALANLAVFYIVSRPRIQNNFSTLTIPYYLKTLIPLVIPIIFIVSNFLVFSGLDPFFLFSSKLNELASLHYQIFRLQDDNDVYSNPINDLEKIFPRIDIVFISIATGSIFIFLKLSGFSKILYQLKDNPVNCLIIILFIFLLLMWSYLLESGFERSDIRHIAYFIPILAIVTVLGLAIKKEPSALSYYILYYYCVVAIFATYYVLHYNIHTLSYDNHFGGFWIDPFKNPIMRLSDLVAGAILIAPLIIFKIKEHKKLTWFKRYNIQKYSSFTLAGLLIVEIYVLSSGGILIAPLEKIDKVAPRGWDENVFDAIGYLKSAQSGSVMSVRAPAISFFTNRTNFDLFNFDAFATLYSHLLLVKNPLLFKQKLLDLGIRYIIIPNEKNPLYHFVQNLGKLYKFKEIIDTDSDFEKISLSDFDMYKFVNHSSSGISNLIDRSHLWKSTNFARILEDNGTLSVMVNNTSNTKKEEKIFNRAYLQTQINLTKNIPLLLSLDYSSQSYKGKAIFYAEISEHKKADSNRVTKDSILWASRMNNTAGEFKSEAFVVPDTVANKPIELKFYIISDGLGKHSLILKRAVITYT